MGEFREGLQQLAQKLQEDIHGTYGGGEYESGVETGRQNAGEALQELLDQFPEEPTTPEQWLPSASDQEDYSY